MRLKRYFTVGAIFFLLPLVGSAQTAEDIDADSRTTFDGLVQVKARGFRNVWLKPGVDPSKYTKIILGAAQFHYRDVPDAPGTSVTIRRGVTEFPIEENSRKRLEEAVVKAFAAQLSDTDNFTVTDQPGPDTVYIWGGLHDIVSRVPPDFAGRVDVYLRSVGEATLVVQIEDSMTREVLARVIDRRAAEPAFPVTSNPVTNMNEVNRLANRWAISFRNGIDRWHESEPIAAEE